MNVSDTSAGSNAALYLLTLSTLLQTASSIEHATASPANGQSDQDWLESCKYIQESESLAQQGQHLPKNPFQGYREQPDSVQSFLGETPQAALIAAAVVIVAGSGFLGTVIGSQVPGKP